MKKLTIIITASVLLSACSGSAPVGSNSTPTTSPMETTESSSLSTQAPTTPMQADDTTYTVVTGDNLWKIAVARYGDGQKWKEIYQINRDVIGSNPGIILAGQQLRIGSATGSSTVSQTSTELMPQTQRSFTLDEVAQHNKESDCYVIVNNDVYDVTMVIDKHPGGRDAIIRNCGKDGTTAFTMRNGKGEHPEMAQQGFEKAKIGTLSK